MTDDVKALIAEARTPQHTISMIGRSPAQASPLVRRLADALEAATVAPAVDREAAVREYVTGDYYRLADQGDSAMLMNSMLDALVESGAIREHTAPAVDREALARLLDESDPEGGCLPDEGEPPYSYWYPQVDALLASGLLRDVRDVQAEALEQAAGAMYGDAVVIGGVPGWLRARAQAIREAQITPPKPTSRRPLNEYVAGPLGQAIREARNDR